MKHCAILSSLVYRAEQSFPAEAPFFYWIECAWNNHQFSGHCVFVWHCNFPTLRQILLDTVLSNQEDSKIITSVCEKVNTTMKQLPLFKW